MRVKENTVLIQRIKQIIFVWFLAIYSSCAYSSNIGIHFTYPLIKHDPKPFYGYRLALWYQPPNWVWDRFSIYVDGSYGHWRTSGVTTYRTLSIYSVAPTVRYYFLKNSTWAPFFNASVGLSYLSNTHIGDRYLGVHFAFQDELGLGATFGPEQRFSITASILHYSNGSLAHVNGGITVPLLITLGYRF
jgi:hypothetical protein